MGDLCIFRRGMGSVHLNEQFLRRTRWEPLCCPGFCPASRLSAAFRRAARRPKTFLSVSPLRKQRTWLLQTFRASLLWSVSNPKAGSSRLGAEGPLPQIRKPTSFLLPLTMEGFARDVSLKQGLPNSCWTWPIRSLSFLCFLPEQADPGAKVPGPGSLPPSPGAR